MACVDYLLLNYEVFVLLPCHNFWIDELTDRHKQMPHLGKITLKLWHSKFGLNITVGEN